MTAITTLRPPLVARIISAVAVVLLGVPAQVGAQWAIEMHAGRLVSAPGAAPVSDGAFSLGISLQERIGGFRLGVGIPNDGAEARWGNAAGWLRLAKRRGLLQLGVDLEGYGALLRESGATTRRVPAFPFGREELVPPTHASTVGGQVLPMAAWEGGRVRVQARAGIAHVRATEGDASISRTVPLGELQLTALAGDRWLITPTIRRYREPDDFSTDYVGVTAAALSRTATVAASVGHWLKRGALATPWSANATLWPEGRVHIGVSVRRDTYDPITRLVPQTAWTVTAGIKIGRLAQPLAPPLATVGRDGRVEIRVAGRHAESAPRIAGDFTGWTPVAMTPRGEDWVFHASLAPGVYQYAFVDGSGRWFVPEGTAGRRDDGMGGHVAVVIVP